MPLNCMNNPNGSSIFHLSDLLTIEKKGFFPVTKSKNTTSCNIRYSEKDSYHLPYPFLFYIIFDRDNKKMLKIQCFVFVFNRFPQTEKNIHFQSDLINQIGFHHEKTRKMFEN